MKLAAQIARMVDVGDFEFSMRDSKFAHLLKPIRDLAENWGVDIANDLEEYLAHLHRTAFAFEGGPALDFAEAALLIQSSACVYSKKVEYLHNLVHQALEVVRLKKRGEESGATAVAEGAAAATGAAGRTARAAAEAEDDSLEGFLAVGSSLKAGDDIDLEEEDGDAGDHSSQAPAALLALEDQGHSVGDGDATSYRLTQCFVHGSGALLLDAVDGDLYDAHLSCTVAVQRGPLNKGVMAACQVSPDQDEDDGGGVGGGMGDDQDEDAEQPTATQQQQQDQGQGQAGGSQPVRPQEEQGAAVVVAPQQHLQGAIPSATEAAGGLILAAPPQQPQREPEVASGGAQPYDPYMPLSMHSKGNLLIRPMVVKRPAKDRINPAVVAARRLNSAKQPTLVTGLINPEFMYALHLAAGANGFQIGQRATANMPGTAACARNQEQLCPVFDRTAAADTEQQELLFGDDQDVGVDPVVGYDDGDSPLAGEWDDAGLHAEPGGDASTADDLLGLVRPLASHGGVDNTHDAGIDVADSYEALCRSHIEAMMAAISAQEVQTELAQRVSRWRNKIDPVLHEEEARSNFDIQHYQQRIIGRLSEASHALPQMGNNKPAAVDFGVIAANATKYEISRTFAAMLQLINNRNIDVLAPKGPDQPLHLQLLTTKLYHESMNGLLEKGAKPNRKEGTNIPSDPLGEHYGDDNSSQVLEDLSAGEYSRSQQPCKKSKRGHAQLQQMH